MIRMCAFVMRCLVIFLLVLGGSAQADDLGLPEPPEPVETVGVDSGEAPAWGLVDASVLRIHASEFRPQNSSLQTTHSYWNTGMTYVMGSAVHMLHAPVILPTGALIVGINFDGYDIDVLNNINWGLRWVTMALDDTSGSLGWYVYSTSAGYFSAYASRSGDPVEPDRYYFAIIDMNKTGQDMRVKGMSVYYKLQISPAPATATFADVPVGAFGFRHIEALAASGITAGCGGGNFCPDNTLTRAEMAVFLAKALGLHWAP